ncbi:MlaD family protein [Belnapia rosea]|uniref:Paraquat-inducible protein B n=1 Tax=Belnapia rosea TaxID=938405 RepID=A0A1G6T2D0_9PROT|nr:MlaD family protein [Belnapia rosea]SDB59499.1 paraquat-inducible protein B [Belnapia rosea]SDD23169.1 paraquat-inducible protein B [Belnapia rosea]
MPQSRGLYLRVGALVLAGLALTVGFVLFFTANRFGRTSTIYETYIRESVQGLDVGSPVRYRGVAIGRVTEVGLVTAEYHVPDRSTFGAVFQLVYVRFAVDVAKAGEVPAVDEAVRLGLRVRIAAQGITGVNYLEMDFLDPARFPPREVPWEPRFPYVPAVPSTVAQVQTAAEQLLQKLQSVDLAGLLDNTVGLIAELRGQLRDGDAAVALREAATLLRSLRGQAEGADLPALAAELRGTAADARALINGRDAQQTLANAAAAMAELRSVVGRLPATLGTLDGSLRNVRGATTDLQAELGPILRDLRVAIANLRDTTEQLRRYPSQAILGAPPPAPESRR